MIGGCGLSPSEIPQMTMPAIWAAFTAASDLSNNSEEARRKLADPEYQKKVESGEISRKIEDRMKKIREKYVGKDSA